MGNIQDLLAQILSARYGRDVRQSIHDAIETCYEDGHAGAIDLQAREDIAQEVTDREDADVLINGRIDTANGAIDGLSDRVDAVEGSVAGCVTPFKVGDTARLHGVFNAKNTPSTHRLQVTVPLNKPIDANVTSVSITSTAGLVARFTSTYTISVTTFVSAQLNDDSAIILEFDTTDSTIESDALTYGIVSTMSYGALTVSFS